MTVHADAFWNQLDLGRRSDRMAVRETHWGFVLTDRPSESNDGFAAEAGLKVMSVVMLFASILPWVVAGGALAETTILAKIALSAAFFFVGFAVYFHANRGFRQEAQVDGVRQEVRFVTRNSRNISSLRRKIAMSDIESCFLNRSKGGGSNAKMLLRLKSRNQPLAVASGVERDLVPALERMADIVKSTRRGR